MYRISALVLLSLVLTGCNNQPGWVNVLSHDKEGNVESGHIGDLISVIRQGCQLRVGWGARRAADATQTIEHLAEPVWVAVRNSENVEVQLDTFAINLGVMGEPIEEHPRRERFGGTDTAISWRANLKTDGTFEAVWYEHGTGDFVLRIPQRHPMRWYADCAPADAKPYFPKLAPTE